MITDETSGVWETWDVFAKVNAQKWRPNGVALFSWGSGANGQLGQNNTTNVHHQYKYQEPHGVL
jgi:hypothetical protein